MRGPRASIATTVIVIIVVTVSLVLGAVGTVAYRYYSQQKRGDFANTLNLEADQIAIGLAPAAWNLEYPQVSKLMESQMRDGHYAGIVVDLETKRFIVARDDRGEVHNRDEEFPTAGLILTQRPIVFSDQKVGQVRLYATPDRLEAELGNAFAFLAISLLLLDAILTLGLYLSLQRLILQPLRRVERYADAVAHGGAPTPALASHEFLGELAGLTDSIDAMVRQLAARHGELQRSTARFQTVIKILPIPLSLYDDQGKALYINDRFASTFGYSLTDIPTIQDWFDRAYPDPAYRREAATIWKEVVDQAQREGVPIQARTYRVRCRDGSEKIVEIGGILSEDVNVAVLDDVTDRTLAEQELMRHRERLEELVTMRTAELAKTYQRLEEIQFAMDHAGIGIAWIDAGSGRFLYVNDQACDLVGRLREDMLALHVVEVATEFTRERLRELAAGLLDKGFARIETTLFRSDGNLLPVEASLYFKAPTEERPGHYIAFLTDISQRKAAEGALVEAKMAAEAAAQARSEFLANMSHEIRTPMNAIIGMSELVLQTKLDKKQRNFVDKVHLSAVSLLGILNDILDFSKVEAGRLDIEHVEFPVERVFDNLANLVALKAEEKNLELLFDIAPEVPSHLVGDPMRLGQILINLAGNAVKFTEQGSVLVSCRVAESKGDQVHLDFAVRDSGIGMSEEQVATLFTPFQQGDNSISRRYGGTGLGLAICKRLAELMGGSIRVDSRLGQGSTFTFSAPFAVPASATEAAVALPAVLRGQRVLVVDDNPDSLEILCSLMGRFGMAVDRAASGQEALALLQRPVRYRVLLCDWKMPGMDGVELVRTMAATPGVWLPAAIIMVSAYGIEELRRLTGSLPLAGILTKPVSASSVLDILLAATGYAPQADPDQREASRRARFAHALAGSRILLVEDNAINQELAQELLLGAGAQVTLANNGREALDKLAANRFDCVLMDVQMPVMDGLEATRAIRAQESLRDLPVVAMTAGALPSEREQTQLAGMNDHVTKPVDVDELFSVMLRCMKRSPATAPAPAEPAAPAATPMAEAVLDVSRGLSTLSGNRQTYLRILKIFLDTGEGTVGNLQEAVGQGDYATISALAHSLKGSAGAVGAVAMQDISRRLDDAARRKDEAAVLQGLQEELRTAWRATREAGADYAAAEAGGPWTGTAGGPEQKALAVALEGLRRQLRADDTDALESLDAILERPLPEPLRAALKELARYVTRYQFAAALRHLERILGSGAERRSGADHEP